MSNLVELPPVSSRTGGIVDEPTPEAIPDPPKVEARKPDKAPSKPKRRPTTGSATDKEIAGALDGIWVGVGGVLAAIGDPYCGGTLLARGPNVTTALIEASKKNDRLREALESFVTASTWGAIASAVVMVGAPILAHHNVIPETFGAMFGPSPDELAAVGIDIEAMSKHDDNPPE
jgi:hypothetical protein